MLRYEDLTFPEVDSLPRDTPWVLPLGDVDLAEFAGWGLLPGIPYGHEGPWRVPALAPLLDSLLNTLAEDGFTQVTLVSSEELPGAWPWRRAPSRPLVRPADARLALVPIGHTEQHGFHLPLSTDSLIIEELARRAACQVDGCWKLPVFPYGVSMHRREFPGTLSLDPRAFEDFWTQLVGCLGLPAVYLVNGHGGNHSFLVNVVKFAGERYPDVFSATSFLHTASGEAWQQVLATRESTVMGHACELETSYVLAIRPDLVHMERCVDEPDFTATPEYGMDWVEEGALIANPPWSDDTHTGSYGNPSCSTARKGEQWLQAAGVEMGRLAREVLEQQQLRAARRQAGWRPGAWRQTTSPRPRPPQ